VPETVAAFRRVLARGSSFPSLVETSSGRLLVLKLSGAGQGSRGLAAELIAGNLAALAGLNVPRAQPLLLPEGLPWQVGTDEFYEAVQRSVGWNLGVQFIPDAVDLEAADLPSLPAEFLSRLAAVDALLQNVDRTTANLNVLRDRFRRVPAHRSPGTRSGHPEARSAGQSHSGQVSPQRSIAAGGCGRLRRGAARRRPRGAAGALVHRSGHASTRSRRAVAGVLLAHPWDVTGCSPSLMQQWARVLTSAATNARNSV
jgi:hypothetical protein